MSIEMYIPPREIKMLEKEIKKLSKNFSPKETQRVFTKASEPYRAKAREVAPQAKKVVKRYSTPKSFSKRRAPKGSGVVVAEYHPGNLGRSFKKLSLRYASKWRAIMIGPKKARNGKGVFRTRGKTDGYYARFLDESFDKTMRDAWNSTRDVIVKNIANEFRWMLRTRK